MEKDSCPNSAGPTIKDGPSCGLESNNGMGLVKSAGFFSSSLYPSLKILPATETKFTSVHSVLHLLLFSSLLRGKGERARGKSSRERQEFRVRVFEISRED